MLMLTRKAGESITLRLGAVVIVVSVTSCDRGRAKFGVEAPPEVLILRSELEGPPKVRR